MSSEDKPEERPTPPAPATSGGEKSDQSTPSLAELDSSWDEDEDEEMTRVAKIPHDLVALSRRGTELEAPPKPAEEPEKHEAITARPPPLGPNEPAVVVNAPHEQLPPSIETAAAEDAGDEEEEDDEEEELAADDLDAGWDIEEERAAAADVAAGLDAEARRKAAEARAAARKEKARAKVLAAKEKRKARAEAIRQKQKKPKKRSIPPRAAGAPAPTPAKRAEEATDVARVRRTDPPEASRPPAAPVKAGPRADVLRMVLIVALVVVFGALGIGLMRR